MVSASEFITLPYSPDLTRAGIEYICRSLSHTHNYRRATRFNHLRSGVAQVSVELAFRRYLVKQDIPHRIHEVMPFTQPGHHYVTLGGRRCDLKVHILTSKTKIRRIRRNPEILLDDHAILPNKHSQSEGLTDKDLYIFAFLNALVTPNHHTLKQAIAAHQPIHLFRSFPESWGQPRLWKSMGTITAKSDSSLIHQVVVGGQKGDRAFQTEHFNLDPGERIELRTDFHALIYAHISTVPDGPLRFHNEKLKDAHIIEPLHWGNMWVYGLEIILTGYITRGDYHQMATLHSPQSSLLPYSYDDAQVFALPISKLHPLSMLFSRTKRWADQKATRSNLRGENQ